MALSDDCVASVAVMLQYSVSEVNGDAGRIAVAIMLGGELALPVYGCESWGNPAPLKLPPTVVALNGRELSVEVSA